MASEWIETGKFYQNIQKKAETIFQEYGFSFACKPIHFPNAKYFTKNNNCVQSVSYHLYSMTTHFDYQIAEWFAMIAFFQKRLGSDQKVLIKTNISIEDKLLIPYDLKNVSFLKLEGETIEKKLIIESKDTLLTGIIEDNKLEISILIYKKDFNFTSERTLILCESTFYKLGVSLSQYYRKQQMPILTQFYAGDFCLTHWIGYCKNNDIGGIFLIKNMTQIEVINVENPNELQSFDISQFSF